MSIFRRKSQRKHTSDPFVVVSDPPYDYVRERDLTEAGQVEALVAFLNKNARPGSGVTILHAAALIAQCVVNRDRKEHS